MGCGCSKQKIDKQKIEEDRKKFCGYTCAHEMKKLRRIMTDIEIFAAYNPGHAKKVIDDMQDMLVETKWTIENIKELKQTETT